MKYSLSLLLLVTFHLSSTTTIDANLEMKTNPIEELGQKLRNWLRFFQGNDDTFVGRCVGAIRQLRLIMDFVIFKLGVIVTALAFLSVMMFKSLGLGVLILIVTTVGLVTKLSFLKHGGGIGHHQPQASVHLHLHNKGESHYQKAPVWYDRLDDRMNPKDSLEQQAIADLYNRIGLSTSYDKFS
ncbi:hypothetical protein RI129_002112 [Pyrocoelia pectoralis]|uniref:Uncharacterized protein n=1 Tax=Pyrocoelia pectoralis TaxID=417401 RepID=A0AAN7VFB6_9COLE